MSLSFLYPLAWLGAAAVIAPIWLHLHRRQEPNVVRFSALQFLDDQPLARRRPLWPRDWLLMLLRLLGLLLLIAAFAWPYLPNETTVVIQESRVYVLDNTLSHQAGGAFERARDEIADRVTDADVATQIAVVQLTAQPELLIGFGDDRSEAAEKLRAQQPSHQRGSYLAAFRQAERLLAQSLGHERRIVLAGDSQANQWDEGLSVPPFLKEIDVQLPEPATETPANVALHRPEVRRNFSGDVALAECVVDLYHQGEVEAATIVVLVNDREMLRREFPLADQPQSIAVAARWESDVADWTRGEVRLEAVDDVLPGDNRVFFSLPPVREGRVGLLAQSPFLKTAVSTEVMRGRWTTQELTPDSLAAPNANADNLDVLVMEGRFLDDSEVRERILDFVNGGRGVLLMIDRLSTVAAGFLRELGVETQGDPAQTATPAGFRYVFMEHPIFRPFRASDFGNLGEITVGRYQRFQALRATALAFSAAGEPLLFDLDQTKGRLLLFAFALDRSDTNWPLHPTFVPFLDRCLQYVRAEEPPPTGLPPGEMCVWQIPTGREAANVIVRPAESADGPPIIRAEVTDGRARFRVPDQPGLYAVSYDENQATVEGMLAVNPVPVESDLRYEPAPEALRVWQAAEEQATSQSPRTSEQPAADDLELSKSEIQRQRIWWWLVLAGLTVLCGESAWTISKREVD